MRNKQTFRNPKKLNERKGEFFVKIKLKFVAITQFKRIIKL